jgi:hypothetical protein
VAFDDSPLEVNEDLGTGSERTMYIYYVKD